MQFICLLCSLQAFTEVIQFLEDFNFYCKRQFFIKKSVNFGFISLCERFHTSVRKFVAIVTLFLEPRNS